MDRQPVLAVDFDGTLSEYTFWKGLGVFGPIFPSAKQELKKLRDAGWIITIWTTRGADIAEVIDFLNAEQVPYDHVNCNAPGAPSNLSPRKIIADVYLDDRALCFTGSWEGMAERILGFKPHYQQKPGTLTSAARLMDADLRRLREANAERADAWRNVGLGGLFLDLRKQYLRCRSFMWERMLNRDPVACDLAHPEHERWRTKSIDILRDLRNYALFIQIALEDGILEPGAESDHWSEALAEIFSPEGLKVLELKGYRQRMSQTLPEDV